MKSSEIITDDIVSRERRRTKDVYDKKTTSQDYFGNKASTKKVDRDLIAKDVDKSVTKNKIGESFSWNNFFPSLKMSDRTKLLEVYFTKNKNLLESNDSARTTQFLNLQNYSATPVAKKKYLMVAIALANDRVILLSDPEIVTFVKHQNNIYYVKLKDNRIVEFPSREIREKIIFETLFFNNTDSYDNYRSMIGLTFEIGFPDINIDEQLEEGSMQAATHNPQGPKFGGYYGATQKGPPKPGQGFGGAAESVGVELDEVAPPGMEDTVLALKKKFPGNPQRAFATAWSIYNKRKGKK